MEYSQKKESAQNAPLTTGAPKNENKVLPGQSPNTEVAKLPFTPTSIDIVFTLVTFLCGYLYIRLVFLKDVGFGVLLFTGVFSATVLAYTYYSQKRVPRYTWWYFGYMIALAGCSFVLENSSGLSFYCKAALVVSAVYWVLAVTGTRRKGLDENLPMDLINGFFVLPFSGFGNLFGCWGVAAKRSKNKNAFYVLCGVIIAVPLLIWVVSLLIQADAAFNYIIDNFTSWINFNFAQQLVYLFLAVPVSCYFFGLFYNAVHHTTKMPSAPKQKETAAATVLFNTILVMFAIVYFIFFGVQVAVTAGLELAPAYTVSYAQYAREGFFQLCQVAAINFVLFFVTRWFCGIKSKSVRILLTIVGVQTLLLIGTAAAKMIIYINHHGFTLLRVLTSWFMATLFVCVVLFILGVWKQFNYLGISVATAALAFLVLCCSNVGGLATQGNIAMWKSGRL
ncbi:MAG: DUF4173 domain-containing protein, partial [Oscillospiraceae bacterium]|nr:DUF4173 domain-containing protein [Oscillospiraceae bacterium]